MTRFTGRLEPLDREASYTMHRVQLERHRFAAEQLISRFELERFDGCEWMRREFCDGSVRRIVADIMGKKRTESVSYPATWWEALKQRFAPAWFLRRWPVQLTTWTVDAFALFPELEPVRGKYLELPFCETPWRAP